MKIEIKPIGQISILKVNKSIEKYVKIFLLVVFIFNI